MNNVDEKTGLDMMVEKRPSTINDDKYIKATSVYARVKEDISIAPNSKRW